MSYAMTFEEECRREGRMEGEQQGERRGRLEVVRKYAECGDVFQ